MLLYSNNSSSEKDQNHLSKLSRLVERSHATLLRIKAVFPFDFFPDEITIDECKVNIIMRDFFFSEDIHSIMIPMIRDVALETGPFFATLKIVPDGYPGEPLSIRYLKKGEALRARRIIQGLMVSIKDEVDVDAINTSNLRKYVEDVGKAVQAE